MKPWTYGKPSIESGNVWCKYLFLMLLYLCMRSVCEVPGSRCVLFFEDSYPVASIMFQHCPSVLRLFDRFWIFLSLTCFRMEINVHFEPRVRASSTANMDSEFSECIISYFGRILTHGLRLKLTLHLGCKTPW